ncbi:hypothetical protein KKI24_03795 [bacterium]|nr:hypothetical protein [bacterium]
MNLNVLPRVDDKYLIDMHVHIGPEFIRRRYNAATLAEEARREGFGVVMKNHFQPTTGMVSMVRRNDDAIPLVGSVALNLGCGGLDKHGIRSALSGWKTDLAASAPDSERFVVWMPTVCAESHLKKFNRRDIDLNWGVDPEFTEFLDFGEGLEIADETGAAKPGLLRALRAVADRDLVLASGHLSSGETVRLVREAYEAGVRRMILTHPLWPGIQLGLDELIDLHKTYGTYSELCFTNLAMHGIDDLTIDDYMEVIRAIGPEGIILSSDCGQTFTPPVAECLRTFIGMLVTAGVSENDIVQMTVMNSNKLLYGDFGD